ncbi:MAG: threonine dehydratase [Gemmatimonadetes bacterium]|nr:threonine dehydratase [Gemmatimonadota bacterium]
MRPLSADRIAEAMAVIDPVFLRSPLLRETTLDRALGIEISLKVETLNPIRSFKGRGTDLLVTQLRDRRLLVCASAGNFGQGLARAARRRQRPLVVYAARNANPLKVDAMRALGAEVRLFGKDFDAAKDAARRFAASCDAYYVEDGAVPEVAEGAGTMAFELSEAGLMPETILAPVGNGALITGIGTWCRHAERGTRVIGVVAEGAPSMQLSFAAREPLPTDVARTIADGIAVREPVPYAVEAMKSTVDEMVSVTDDAIVRAMRLVLLHTGIVVEPAGAAGIAALLEYPERWRGGRVAVPLCGGNVTQADARKWLLAPNASA